MYKKLIIVIILLLGFMLMPNVYAKDANVTIKSIEKVGVTGKAEEVNEATISNGTLNFNLLFLEVGDSIKYKVVVENKDNEDYSLVINSNDEYVAYLVENNIIKKNATTEVTLTAKYNKELPVEQKGQQITKTVKVNVTDQKGNILNPKTGRNIVFIVLILLVLVISSLLIKNKKVKSFVLLLEIGLLPIGVSALNSLVLTISSTYEVADENIVYESDLRYYDNNDNAHNYFYLGEQFPTDANKYLSPTQAMNAWVNNSLDRQIRPFYLKYKLSNNIIEESYIGFELNGKTYSLRGYGSSSMCSYDSQYYNQNKETLFEAFGTDNCHEDLDWDDGYKTFYCNNSDEHIFINNAGDVYIEDNKMVDGGFYSCDINCNGESYCSLNYPEEVR